MRIAIIFHKDPFAPPTGIDLVRLRAISFGLAERCMRTEIIAPILRPTMLDGKIPVYGLDRLENSAPYDIVKTCYHDSIRLVPSGTGNIVSRIVRVVDHNLPKRDERFRTNLLECQELILRKAHTVIFNNEENRSRWLRMYGGSVQTALVPTGCPSVIPSPGKCPYKTDKKVLLFLGSVASPRMLIMLNELARSMREIAEIHLVGLNKSLMYGDGTDSELDPLIVTHGAKPEIETWDYIYHADLGLALATGPHSFDNDISKIYSYLRGGLPTLSEEQILNNELVVKLGYGDVFGYGDINALISRCKAILSNRPIEKRRQVMRFMVKEHSWDERVGRYLNLFEKIVGSKQ
ncbi:MAG: glycosyltransferase family protein [Desulfomonilaceae bacterium]